MCQLVFPADLKAALFISNFCSLQFLTAPHPALAHSDPFPASYLHTYHLTPAEISGLYQPDAFCSFLPIKKSDQA